SIKLDLSSRFRLQSVRDDEFGPLNDLFNGESVDDLCRFYENLADTRQLVEFCMWRRDQRGEPGIYVHNKDRPRETVVVVLTPRADDRYALDCRKIFYNCPIIFVHGTSPYFNESYYFNVGIEEAQRYDPDWIILSSDDVYKVDDARILVEGLSRLDNREFDH